jgi:hypothetical protein
LDAESAALALGDVDGVAVAAADLVEDGLAGEAGVCGGVGEADVARGDVGAEAPAGVVVEDDAPGSMRCCLLGGQEPFAQPADGLGTDSELSGSFVDRYAVVSGGRAAGHGGDVRALADPGDARGGERQAGCGALALFGEDHRDLRVWAVLGEPADQRHDVLGCVGAFRGRAVERDGELGVGAAVPEELDARPVLVAVDGEYDVVQQEAQQLFAVAVVGGGSVPDAREVGGEALEGVAFAVAQRRGALTVELV